LLLAFGLVPVMAAFGLSLIGCGRVDDTVDPPDTNSAWFEDVTDKVGLRFQHEAGPLPVHDHYFMPQLVGSGAAMFDMNNDGGVAIYLLQNGGPSGPKNALFQRQSDGTFKDISAGSGLDVTGWGMGVAVGDINNDGLPDVLVTEHGRIRLFLNLGRGKFRDVTEESGLASTLWGTGAAFFDYDRDGWLDLVVVNYIMYDEEKTCNGLNGKPDYCGPQPFAGSVTKLFHNRGPASPGGVPRFEDVTSASGFDRAVGPGLGVVCADFNGDGWPDVLISNDGKPNHLWINQKNGTFTEEAKAMNIAYDAFGKAMAGMGIAVGDLSCEGRLDVFMPHLDSETNTLWRQTSRGMFRDDTLRMGVAASDWRATGFGTVFADFNHDGKLDLAIVNGGVQRGARPEESCSDPFWKWYVQRNQLFINEGNNHFRDISPSDSAFCDTPLTGRGLVCGDFDGDGALDILVTAIAGPARLYKNVVRQRGHWLMVKAIDPALGGRDAYGAEVTITAGGRRQMNVVGPAYSYLCSNDPRVHFGLGGLDHVDRIEVTWPDGKKEIFPMQKADQILTLPKGSGKSP
jgi:hypothetical protein